MMMSSERPSASSAVKPKICAAPLFQKRMTPSASAKMIASGAFSARVRQKASRSKRMGHRQVSGTHDFPVKRADGLGERDEGLGDVFGHGQARAILGGKTLEAQ